MMNNAAKTPRYNVEEYYQAIQNSEQPTELLDGELVAMASPSIQHQRICGNLQFFIKQYVRRNHGTCEVFTAPTDVQLDEHNLVIPDVFIACHPDWFDSQKYNGAPDFVAEVVSTNRSDDFDRKLWLYRIHGVREYWIIDPKHEKVLVYFFEESVFPNMYSFDTPIPVRIYQNAEHPLSIIISELF